MTSIATVPHELAISFDRPLTTDDWPLLREIMAPDFTWMLPGDSMIRARRPTSTRSSRAPS